MKCYKGSCHALAPLDPPLPPLLYDFPPSQMVIGDFPAIEALPHMSRVTQSVYATLLRAHIEEQGWGDVVSSQVSDFMVLSRDLSVWPTDACVAIHNIVSAKCYG